MIQIAEMLPPVHSPLWDLVAQCGVTEAVGALDFDGHYGAAPPWSHTSLLRVKSAYEDGGFQLAVIESRPPLTKAKLGLPGRDEEIDTVCELLDSMGRLGIAVWCYEWMPVLNWMRTSTTIRARGGALVSGYDHSQMLRRALDRIRRSERGAALGEPALFPGARDPGRGSRGRQAGDAPG